MRKLLAARYTCAATVLVMVTALVISDACGAPEWLATVLASATGVSWASWAILRYKTRNVLMVRVTREWSDRL